MAVKVLVVDDHPITRAGVRAILETENDITIVGEAKDGLEAIEKTIALSPDIVVMDISMPKMSGIDATREILKNHSHVKVIALSIHAGERFVREMLESGASGYILKDEAPEELYRAISKVRKGDMYLSSTVTRTALQQDLESNDVKVLQSKLHRPPVLGDYVPRAAIIHELENNVVKPLSVVSAGAGYGKSVTVSQWLEQTEYLNTWVSLDKEHNDLRTFLGYLVFAVEKIFPGFLKQTNQLISSASLPPISELIHTLINELCDIDEDFILVLDDYHQISNERVHQVINEWLRFPPPAVHLCIITRRDPPLEIRSLKLNGRVTEIRMNQLSFTNDEATELFKHLQGVKLSDDDIAEVLDKTEGWILAIRLLSMIIKDDKEVRKVLDSIGGGLQTISEYLLTEVLSQQPQYIQNLIMDTALLNRFCEEVIVDNHLQDQTDANPAINLVQFLTSFNLFVIPLDGKKKWYRFHHLFQDFLQNQLKKRKSIEEIHHLHIAYSKWFEAHGLIDEALEHAVKGDDVDRVVSIVAEHWEEASDADDFLIVDQWLSHIPEKVKDSSINLLFARFYSIFKGHRLDELPEILQLILQTDSKLSEAEQGYIAFVHTMLDYYAGNGEKSAANALKAIRLIPDQYTSFIGDARTYWFISMIMLGKQEEAYESHKKDIRKFEELNEPVQLGRVRTNVGFLALFTANLPLLKQATEEMAKTPGLSNFMLGFLWLNRQLICWFSNDPQGVIDEGEKVISVKYEFTSRLVVDCFIMMALAFEELGNRDEANKTIERALEYARYTNDPSNVSVASSGRARVLLQQGKLDEASEWLDSTQPGEMNATVLWCIEEPLLTRCRVQITRGGEEDLSNAVKSLSTFLKYAESVHNTSQAIQIGVLYSVALVRQHNNEEALQALTKVIGLAAEGEWIRPFIEYYADISSLLVQLLETTEFPEFIDSIIKSQTEAQEKAAESVPVNAEKQQRDDLTQLTPKELEVLKYIADGLRNQEIADKLFNSPETIKRHIYNMFQKMNVKNRLSLVTMAKEKGILTE